MSFFDGAWQKHGTGRADNSVTGAYTSWSLDTL